MTDLTKIEKPYGLCNQEEQEGIDALKTIPCALQFFHHNSVWLCRLPFGGLSPAITCRQNPDWNPPKLDVPDWFWENTDCNCVAMDQSGEIFAYVEKPYTSEKTGVFLPTWGKSKGSCKRIDRFFTYNFNPHNIPWDQSLTVRPGFEE